MPTTPGPATADGDAAAALAALSSTALDAADEADLVAALVPVAYELLGTDQLHLVELSADRAVGHASVLLTDGRPPQGYTMVFDDRPSGAGRVAVTGELLHVPDAPASELVRQDFTARFDIGSALFVPLAWDDAVRWVAVFIRRVTGAFTDGEVELARVLCNLHAAGLALLEAREATRSRSDRGSALAQAVAAVAARAELVETLAAVSEQAHAALGADSAGVYLADGSGGGIATAGFGTPADWVGYRMQPGEGVGGRVLQSGRSAFTNAYQREIALPTQPALRRLQTAVAVPIRADGQLLGALSIGFERLRRIDAGDLRALEAFADLASVACAR